MAQSIRYTLTAAVTNGPSFSINESIEVEAYDNIVVTVSAGASDFEVELQPGGSGQVKCVLITSGDYDEDLTFKINNAANPAVKLDQPHFYAGIGAVSRLDPAPASLFFSSALADDTSVTILVGRDATP